MCGVGFSRGCAEVIACESKFIAGAVRSAAHPRVASGCEVGGRARPLQPSSEPSCSGRAKAPGRWCGSPEGAARRLSTKAARRRRPESARCLRLGTKRPAAASAEGPTAAKGWS